MKRGARAFEFAADLADYFANLAIAAERLLLLDYDGTLAPFHVDPTRAEPYGGVREILDEIMRDAATQVVIISGRPARDVWPLLKLRRQPAVWGSHGWECLGADGDYRCGPLDARPIRRVLQDQAWVRDIENRGGRFERKPGSLAIHWRGLAPECIADVREAVLARWNSVSLESPLQWSDFDGGIELRVPGRDKGYAIETLLAEYPNALAAYLGDDLTDEDAFTAIKGRGLAVLVRPDYRPTSAQVWLRPPAELLDFLIRWQAVGRKERL